MTKCSLFKRRYCFKIMDFLPYIAEAFIKLKYSDIPHNHCTVVYVQTKQLKGKPLIFFHSFINRIYFLKNDKIAI